MGELLYNEDSHSSRVGVLSLVLFESILLHRWISFCQQLQVAGEVGCGINLTVH